MQFIAIIQLIIIVCQACIEIGTHSKTSGVVCPHLWTNYPRGLGQGCLSNSIVERTSFLVSYQLWNEISILLTVMVPNGLGFSM